MKVVVDQTSDAIMTLDFRNGSVPNPAKTCWNLGVQAPVLNAQDLQSKTSSHLQFPAQAAMGARLMRWTGTSLQEFSGQHQWTATVDVDLGPPTVENLDEAGRVALFKVDGLDGFGEANANEVGEIYLCDNAGSDQSRRSVCSGLGLLVDRHGGAGGQGNVWKLLKVVRSQ